MDRIGGVIIDIMRKSVENVIVNDEDYEVDGLLYCGKCNTPKMQFLHIFDRDVKVGTICKCERERQQKEKESEAICEEQQKIERNKRTSGLNAEQLHNRFECAICNEYNEKQLRYCKNYAEKFDEMIKRSQGLLMYGPPGTGKSFLASCIANYLLDKGVTVKAASTIDIVGRSSFYKEDEHEEYVESIIRPDLFIIDDLGAERNTDFALERVHDIIEYRTGSGKPMIVTTNYSLRQMKNETEIRKLRTFDRIFSCCFPIPFTGSSFRKQRANSSYSDIKNLLEG